MAAKERGLTRSPTCRTAMSLTTAFPSGVATRFPSGCLASYIEESVSPLVQSTSNSYTGKPKPQYREEGQALQGKHLDLAAQPL
jgi:hypothetical protein